jgi:transglutaminase-like putative cysteine protease
MGMARRWNWEGHRSENSNCRLAEDRMTELIIRLGRKLFTADVMGLLLILTALQIFTMGIAASLPNTDTKYFFAACLIAVLLSVGLAKRNSGPYPAAAGMAALGGVGVWIIGARLAIPLINLLRSVVALMPQVIPAVRSQSALDTAPIQEAWAVVAQASIVLAFRFQTWLMGFGTNVRVNDSLIRNMIWLLILWLVAAWMGWFTARRNATLALMPSVLLLAFVTSYSEFKVEMLWGLVFVMLLLMGVWNYKNHTHQWESRKVDYSDSIRYDNTQAVVVLAVLVGLIAFVTPSISWRAIRDYFRERNENQVARALGVQEQPLRAISVPTQKPSLPRDHLLSGGFANSEELVMTIRTGELPPIANPSFASSAPSYYWRSVVYDQYAGTGWVASSAPSQKYSANTPLIPGLLNGYKPLHFDVQLAQPEGKIFWSGTLFSADIPLTVIWRFRPTSNLFADQSALLQADMFAAASSSVSYSAETYIPDVTIAELRSAPADYPEQIRARYLQLPRDLPDRVERLARQITNGKTNPYDKVKAIESYLRNNYPYDLEVPAPPADQDVADYFLFDLKKGYCDYYATAMVVLARASGVPARFVSGYSPGTYDAPNAQYVIRELNAHSWVEVYFSEIGWVEFEPTASVPEIVRKERDDTLSSATDNAETDSVASRLLARFRWEQLSYILLPLFGLLLVLLLYFTVIEPWWYLRRLSPTIAIERMYRKFYRAGRPLTEERLSSETAHEFAERIINLLSQKFSTSRFKFLYANTRNEVTDLTGLYHIALFRDIQIQKKDSHIAWKLWKRLRWQLWFARMKMSLRALFAKPFTRSKRLD